MRSQTTKKDIYWKWINNLFEIKKLRKGGFHLKAYVSVAGPDLLAIGSSEAAKDILRVIDRSLFSFIFSIIELILLINRLANERDRRV